MENAKSIPQPKQAIYQALSEVAQAIGHVHRLELLEAISQGPRSVEALAEATGLSVANASRHLQLLRRARLVEPKRQGKRIFYSLSGESEVVALLRALGCFGERNVAEVQGVMRDFFEQRDALEPVSRETLLERMASDGVMLLDVRPSAEYALGHLPGALNCPASELEKALAGLPRDKEIVAYCRGPYCVMSFEVVAKLRELGFNVRRLEDGFPEWKAAGLQVVTEPYTNDHTADQGP
ncbi:MULTISPECIES: ArsR/SmtB family transcription factor [Stenotrophomonas]|jgi:rhodanese-related sulfurtransferase|uniref:ArsR/SmtB family transcription factor n=1 Tax=Stenotrophomonas TaxID=40323 RepID=UPI00038F89DF|nr:metalloregulator ArsR/SmtB family transcription factor [Stenotrophomonas maltophilia]EQM88090.1 ArsR family transcriptional regulator [Stenotrophomonas maltophilia MF89]OHY71874.1 ArsR family transcriptional regulator [Stenotrophomonas maltophilia]UUS13691.1 metalloregulator ArsR/SmtB family transcription factor [Stenotrophomonas sp. CD2]